MDLKIVDIEKVDNDRNECGLNCESFKQSGWKKFSNDLITLGTKDEKSYSSRNLIMNILRELKKIHQTLHSTKRL